MSALLEYLLQYPDVLASRDTVIDYFVDSPLVTREEMLASRTVRPGKLFQEDGKVHIVVSGQDDQVEDEAITKLSVNFTKLKFDQEFTLEPGVVANHKGKPVETTLGILLLNHVILVKSFGPTIPYYNDRPWNLKKLEKQIAEETVAGNLTTQQVYDYITNSYTLTGYNDFCVPALTEKSITSNKKVAARRKELLEKYKDQLGDPNVMTMIEDELIALDRKELEGDDSNGFMISGKNYDVHRKRMFGLVGMVGTFGDDQKDYEFSQSNLNDGWDLDELPMLNNDVRKGIYGRAKDTALGGVETKVLGRTFQDAKLVSDDCGTKKGLPVVVTSFNKHHFSNRHRLVNDKPVLIKESDLDGLIGKQITIRSPMYCREKTGYCYTCHDARFKQIGIKLLNMSATNLSSNIMKQSLKAMHGVKVSLLEVDDLNEFVLPVL